MTVLVIIIAIAIIVAVFYFASRRKAKLSTANQRTQDLIDSLVVQVQTPLGVGLLSRTPRSPEIQGAIDAEFQNMQAIAAKLNFTNKLAPNDYTVLVFPSERDVNPDGVYCPSFRVYFDAGNSYDGSMYDQEPNTPGGWTYAAEQVLDLEQCRFIIAESDNVAYVRECIHNGMDHIILYHNDRARFEATKDHSQGGGHPILT